MSAVDSLRKLGPELKLQELMAELPLVPDVVADVELVLLAGFWLVPRKREGRKQRAQCALRIKSPQGVHNPRPPSITAPRTPAPYYTRRSIRSCTVYC